MLHKESDFEYAAQYFLSSRGQEEVGYSLKQPSQTSPGTRILSVDGYSVTKFIVKVHREPFPMDKNSPHLQNEIAAQALLKDLGYSSKEYLMSDLDGNNEINAPITVSTFINGQTLENADPEKISLVAPKVLDYLFIIHSRTISSTYGYLPGIEIKRPDTTFAEFESSYLISDIKRDHIPFSIEEQSALKNIVSSLNSAEQFCLCHCDVTLRNTLWDGKNVNLIDWTYCHYSEPGFDIANVIFWLTEYGLTNQVKQELLRSSDRYNSLGFNIAPSFLFYLSQRYIEYGRIKGQSYIDIAKKLQNDTVVANLSNLIECLTRNALRSL